MGAVYNELLETNITAMPPMNINTPNNVKTPIAQEIQKNKKNWVLRL